MGQLGATRREGRWRTRRASLAHLLAKTTTLSEAAMESTVVVRERTARFGFAAAALEKPKPVWWASTAFALRS